MTQDIVNIDIEAALRQAALDGAFNAYKDLEQEYQRLDAGKARTKYKSALDIVKRKENKLALEGEVRGFRTEQCSPTYATEGSGNVRAFLVFLAAVFLTFGGLVLIFEILRAL